MSSEVSLIAEHPFVQKFVLEILKSLRGKNLVRDERFVVHADLVPKVSTRNFVPQEDRRQRVEERNPVVVPLRVPTQKVMPPRLASPRIIPPRTVPPRIISTQPQMPPPMPESNVGLSQDYGKVTPLLNDVSISTIECFGAGKPLMVVRAGTRQPTKIVLGGDDINEFLDKVSDAVHIPILEGVFRAAVDNFSVNAVISEIIGSRFVIKKQTAYAMFEK